MNIISSINQNSNKNLVWQYKYLKYKKKYISIKNQKGGAPLLSMPQLCFGTAQLNLKINLTKALRLGYRHIDGAENYGKTEYKNIIKECIKIIPREQLWITWKCNSPTLEYINSICTELDCQYIDLFLFHHSCGTEEGYYVLKEAQELCLIRYYGVSNCEDLSEICRLKSKYNIFANQIQARPPKGKIIGRNKFNPPNFIEECNKIGVNIMLFSSITGFTQSPKFIEIFYNEQHNLIIDKINKYYIQNYIKEKSNVLIVSSSSDQSDFLSIIICNYLDKNILLQPEEMRDFEQTLEKIELKKM
jgi:diketogulonate reductase-like aldo/keto reductase